MGVLNEKRCKRKNLNLTCLKDTYLIKKINDEQSPENKIEIKQHTLLKCFDIIDSSNIYYQIFLLKI